MTAWLLLSERNRKINLAHEFNNLRGAQADTKDAEQYITKLLEGIE